MVWWGLVIIALVAVLNQSQGLERFYLGKSPVSGGVYSESVVGEVKTINPILPENSATVDASRLVFSGLTRLTPTGQLEPELAESWQLSQDGLKYTFNLRKGIKWHDGVEFTAQDVAFTISAIQHPDSRSPLAAEWKGVKAEPAGSHRIVFTLPNPYVGFTHLTTVGILPRHLLESINPSSLRIVNFNQKPIGTGPFKIKSFVPGETAIFDANPAYFRGKPKLEGFMMRFYQSDAEAIEAFAKRQVNAVGRVAAVRFEQADKIEDLEFLRYRTTEQTNLFFKTTSQVLKDKSVRQALALATDRQAIVEGPLGGLAHQLFAPILPGQLGYTGKLTQPRKNTDRAKKLLDESGWGLQGGVRKKGEQPLSLKLVTLNDPRLDKVAEELRKQWQEIGVQLEIHLVNLDELIQSHIKPRQYDVLLYGITIGPDPDVYPYWHSSQVNDPGLNLSQYKSAAADAALEVGRITTDPDVRAGKYQAFLQAFKTDTPAVVLYAEDYFYGVGPTVLGQTPGILSQPADRFYGVENWTVKTRPTILK